VREGRRRRQRAIGSAAAVLAVVALAVPVAGALSGGSDQLTVAGPGRPSASPTSTGATSAPSTPLIPAAYREDTDVNAAGGGPCAPASPGGDALCRYTGGTVSGSVLRAGDVATVVLGYCLPRDAAGDYVFAFAGGQEKDVVVTPSGATSEAFRFSSTVRYVDGAHERRLRRGQCIEWTGRWSLVTTDGAPVPPGVYALTLTVAADEESQANVDGLTPRLPETVTVDVTVALAAPPETGSADSAPWRLAVLGGTSPWPTSAAQSSACRTTCARRRRHEGSP
jgi:hypothetical protein